METKIITIQGLARVRIEGKGKKNNIRRTQKIYRFKRKIKIIKGIQ